MHFRLAGELDVAGQVDPLVRQETCVWGDNAVLLAQLHQLVDDLRRSAVELYLIQQIADAPDRPELLDECVAEPVRGAARSAAYSKLWLLPASEPLTVMLVRPGPAYRPTMMIWSPSNRSGTTCGYVIRVRTSPNFTARSVMTGLLILSYSEEIFDSRFSRSLT